MRWIPERETAEARETPPPDVSGLVVERLVHGPPPSAEEIDAFLRDRELPVVEGDRCTFLYRGEADAVRLRHWIFGLPSDQPFHRLAGTDLWYHVLTLPEGSRVEYKLEITRGRRVEWIQDPLNPRVAHDPFGANSVCHAAGYETPDWTQPQPGVPEGSLEERVFRSPSLGATGRVTLYRPARFRETRRYPLLVVHDGGDYLRYASLKTVLDNLIARLEIPEVVAALLDPPDRMEHYRGSAEHTAHLVDELIPRLEAELPLVGKPRGRCLMGASLGAVASLAAAIEHPGFFGSLLLQSGSFAFSDIGEHDRGPLFDPIAEIVNRYRRSPTAVAERVFLSCGTYESLIYENRSLFPVLEGTGMDVRFMEARDGHNWENWRDRLRDGLSWLFPGPLWLVYP